MLSSKEKLAISSFVPSSAFQVLKKMVAERIRIIEMENPKQENQFQTILKVGEQEGRIKELKELIIKLENDYRKSRQ